MFCSKCGKQIEADSRFCEYCGADVGDEGSVQQANETPKTAQRKKGNVLLYVTVGVVLVLAVGAGLYFFTGKDGGDVHTDSDANVKKTSEPLEVQSFSDNENEFNRARVKSTDGFLNLRAGPSANYEVLFQVPTETVINVFIDEKSGQWVKVEYNKTVGWVNETFLRYLDVSGICIDEMIIKTAKLLQNSDEVAINQLIYPDIGIVIYNNPGAFTMISVIDNFSLNVALYGAIARGLSYGSVEAVINTRIRRESLPVYECEEGWTKPKGIYYQPVDLKQGFFSPTNLAHYLSNIGFTIEEDDMKKYERLERESEHYRVVILGGDNMDFTITLIDNRWYLTMINLVTPCDA